MAKTPSAEVTREKSLLEQLADGLEINKHELDEAWVLQPDVFWRVCEGLSAANNARDKYKLVRDGIITEVGLEMREAAEAAVAAAGKGRVVETAIARDIENDDRVVDARARYQSMCYAAERWAGLKESYSQRSYALKDLTALHISNYYQSNSGGESRDRVADKNRTAAGEERRKRT